MSDFAEFAANRPLFVLSDDGKQFQVAQNRRLYFAEESFSATKLPNEYRIFVFGGSTVKGRPFSIPTSFTTFMEIGLNRIASDVKWEVVNCGGISYASYRVLPIVKECIRYQPDLYIVCCGHNEFLECISYADVKDQGILTQSYSWLDQLNSFHLAQTAMEGVGIGASKPKAEATSSLSEEVDAILDHQGGLEAYCRAALNSDAINSAFGNNLKQMIAIAESAGVPIMLVSPPSNLRDCPPFKSEFSESTSPANRDSITDKLNRAFELLPTDSSASIQLLKSATEDDPKFAISWYQLGRALVQANRLEEALIAFKRAQDEDVCPLRMTSALRDTLSLIADGYKIPLLNADKLLSSRSRNGIPGNAVLVDHVHPSFGSHQNIAVALIEMMSANNFIPASGADWKAAAMADFEMHLQSLDNMYFLSGRRTLETLELWTQGRGDGPPLAPAKK